MAFFTVQGLRAGYAKCEILNEINFFLPKGQVCGLLGANGSGKTTLIKAMCGILSHDGHCTLDGEELEGLSVRNFAKKCAYIPQQSGIGIALSCEEVVLMAFNPQLKILQRPTKAMRQAAREALTAVGLAEKAGQDFQTLSAGQKQLCLLARAMAGGASMLFLDEPESALDFSHRLTAMRLLQNWAKAGQRCVLAALHDPQLALNECGMLVLLKDGRILGQFDPRTTPLQTQERWLCELYGPLHLTEWNGKRALFWEEAT